MNLRTHLAAARMFAGLVGRLPAGHLGFLLRQMRGEKPHRFRGQLRVNSFFPPYPSRAYDRFRRALIERRRAPFSAYLAVTGACPCRCAHCSYAGRAGVELSREEVLGVLGDLKAIGGCTVGFTGGEPLLRGEIEEFVRAAGPELATVVFTSGHGLDEARARRLAGAGAGCVTVGIESADPKRHDADRGVAGSFEQVRRAVAACRDAGLYAALSTVATRERLDGGELERIWDLGRRWGAQEFRVLSPVATGAWAGRGDRMLTGEERARLARFHVDHNRRKDGPAVACFARLESAETFGCGAGYHHLFIDAAGNVCPCDLTPLAFGNVREKPLPQIWKEMEEHFRLPRRRCLMVDLAAKLSPSDPRPLPPNRSRALCPRASDDEPLPESYRRLLKGRKR